MVTATRNYREAVRQAWAEIKQAARDLAKTEREIDREAKRARNETRRAIAEVARARVRAAEEEVAAIRAAADAERELRDARLEVRDAGLALLSAEDDRDDQGQALRESLEAIGLAGEDLAAVLHTLSTADLASLDIGALFAGVGIELTPRQIEKVSDAARGLQQAQLGVEGAANAVADANSDLADSQARVTEFTEKGLKAYGPYAEALRDVKAALREVGAAEDAQRRLMIRGQKELQRSTVALQRLREKDIADYPAVIAAAEALRDAHQGVADALHAQRRALQQAGAAGGGGGGGGGYGGEVEKLTQLEQNFVDALDKVKAALSRAFTPATNAVLRGLTDGMRAIIPLIDELKPGLTAVGQVIGGLARSAGKALAGPEWTRALKYFTASSAVVTKLVGESFGELAEILRDIAVASMPFLIAGLRKVRDFLQGVSDSTKNIGGLRDSIGGLVDHLRSWLNLARSLGGLMIALLGGETAKAGQGLVDSLAKGADNLARWARSAEGQEKIKAFFEDVMPLVASLGKLFGALVVAALAFTQAVAPIAAPIIDGFTEIVGVITSVLGLFTKIPAPIRAVVGVALSLVVGFGKVKAAGKLLEGGFTLLIGLLGTVGGAFGELPGIVSGAASSIVSAAGEVAGKVVEGLTGTPALVKGAGEWFVRTAKDGIEAVPSIAKAAGAWVTRRVKDGVEAIASVAKAAGEWVVRQVKNGAEAVPNTAKAAGEWVTRKIRDGVEAVADVAKKAGEWVVRRIKEGVEALADVASKAGEWVTRQVRGGVEAIADVATKAGEWIVRQIKAGVEALADVAIAAGKWIGNQAKDGLEALSGAFLKAGEAVVTNFAAGIKAAAQKAVDAAKWVGDKVTSILPGSEPKDPTSPLRGLPERGRALIENFTDGVRAAMPELSRTLSAGLAASVNGNLDLPQVAPAAAAAGSVTHTYNLGGIHSPAGTIADPEIALAQFGAKLRARGKAPA